MLCDKVFQREYINSLIWRKDKYCYQNQKKRQLQDFVFAFIIFMIGECRGRELRLRHGWWFFIVHTTPLPTQIICCSFQIFGVFKLVSIFGSRRWFSSTHVILVVISFSCLLLFWKLSFVWFLSFFHLLLFFHLLSFWVVVAFPC